MTARELIEHLKKLHPEHQVMIENRMLRQLDDSLGYPKDQLFISGFDPVTCSITIKGELKTGPLVFGKGAK